MLNEWKIETLRARQRLLASRGPHNLHIIAKLERKIRKLQAANAVF